MAQHHAINGIGAMATGFLGPQGGFNGENDQYMAGKPDSSDGSFFFPQFDARVRNAQYAIQNTQAFGAPLPQGMGMMAGILPAALKIEEHKKMQEVAERYYEKYIKDFNRKYGFTGEQIEELVKEFNEITEEICRLIPDDEMRSMYRKYIESYPTMYLSMIPAEALQTKLAVKCVTESKNLRKKVEDMSACVSSLVKNLTDLQISAGIPPIVNLMFESMPDPLTAITDPMYHKYNDSIVVYHKLLKDEAVDQALTRIKNNEANNVSPADDPQRAVAGFTNAELLRLEPVHFLNQLSTDVQTTAGEKVTLKEIKALQQVMENMQSQSGCQPFGDEWNHTGPTPAMNPAMCLGEDDKFQSGNPRHDVGRTNLYQAKRDSRGNAHWVQAGEIPALSGGAQQMVQPQAPGWEGVSHMAGVDPRPTMPSQQMQPTMQQMQPTMQQMQQFQQPGSYTQPYGAPKSSKKKASKASKTSKKSKKSTNK